MLKRTELKQGTKTLKKTPLKRKPPKKKRKKSSSMIAKDKAWDAFSRFIRTRDCLRTTGTITHGKCVTCEKEKPFKKLQAGHLIPGRFAANLFTETGVHAQCGYCNGKLEGNTLVYREFIIKQYGISELKWLIANNKLTITDRIEQDYKYIESGYQEKLRVLLLFGLS